MIKEFITKIKTSFKTKPQPITQYIGSGISPRMSAPMQVTSYGSGSKFPGGIKPSNLITIHDHAQLRAECRNAMYDSTEMRSLVESIVDTVVDTGLRVKPTPISEILGITPEVAEAWAEDVATRFHIWAKSKKSQKSRINNFYQNQRLYELFQQRDNDIFTRLYYSRDKDLINPLQIDFIDPNQIKGDAFTSTYSQFGADDGIVRDASGRETEYKVWNFDVQTGKYTDVTIPAVGEKSGRVFMLHGYNPEYAGQGRGYPRMSHLIQEFHQLTDFKISHIQKAINQSSFIAAIENDIKDPSNPVIGRVAGPAVITASPTAEAASLDDPLVNWDLMPEATIRQPGSTLVGNLKRGDRWKNLQDTSPSAQYDMFEKSFFTSICASTGWSIEVVRKQFSNNYSASRATLILIYRNACIWREEMNSDFNDPIYEMWLSEEIAAGRVSAPGWYDNTLRAAWLNCEWAGQGMPNIDPLKSVQASKLAIELGNETLDDSARDYNGSSGKANRTKLTRQYGELPEPTWGWPDGGKIQQTGNDDDPNIKPDKANE